MCGYGRLKPSLYGIVTNVTVTKKTTSQTPIFVARALRLLGQYVAKEWPRRLLLQRQGLRYDLSVQVVDAPGNGPVIGAGPALMLSAIPVVTSGNSPAG